MSIGAAVALTAASFTVAASTAQATDPDPATQQYRPYVHYTPEANWMNDPNGLVYHNGKYHMYYQYNPNGTRWGDMSWGHASSTDLIHWEEQPLAIPRGFNGSGQVIEEIFSGSVVVDTQNTSGLGTLQNPPLVATYASNTLPAHPTLAGKQAQSLAFSTQRGQTWTKYGNNPVLNRNTSSFRDPKVFWYDNPGRSGHWVMAAVEEDEHRVLFYKSNDLLQWDYLDDFGSGKCDGRAVGMPGSVPPCRRQGDPNSVKWVLAVNINPGASPAAAADNTSSRNLQRHNVHRRQHRSADQLPPGNVHAGFNGSNYSGWTSRTIRRTVPAPGEAPPPPEVFQDKWR